MAREPFCSLYQFAGCRAELHAQFQKLRLPAKGPLLRLDQRQRLAAHNDLMAPAKGFGQVP